MKLSTSRLGLACLLALAGLVAPLLSEEEPHVIGAPRPRADSPAYASVKDVAGLPRVLIVGDSISIGYTLTVRDQLRGVANIHRPAENCGDTKRGLERLDAWLGMGTWDLIHFNFGLHDIRYVDPHGKYVSPDNGVQATSPADYERNLRRLVRRLKATGATLVFATTTPVPGGAAGRLEPDAIRYNEIAIEVMQDEGVAVNDLFILASAIQAETQLKQNVHFTPQGYDLLAGQVTESIVKALGLRPGPR
ncbi:MAG TPA: SGNH/GDSL hydrolase family protein [Opitutaceae bacterium]